MSNNRLTPQEKQMPVIRLPLRIAVFAWADLFAAFVMCMIMLTKSNIPGLIACLIVLGVPALIGLILYSNHMIRFDKDNIVYRDFRRKVHRFTFGDILFAEKQHKYEITTENVRFTLTDHTQNEKWFLELAGRKKAEPTKERKLTAKEQKIRKEGEIAFIAYLICGILFLAMYLFFFVTYILEVGKVLFFCNAFLLAAIGCAWGVISSLRSIKHPEKEGNYDDGEAKGIYLFNVHGRKSSGSCDLFLIFGVVYLCIGIVGRGLCLPLCATGCVLLAIFAFRERRVQTLHLQDEKTIAVRLKNHAPSRDLKTLLEQEGKHWPENGVRRKTRREKMDDPYLIENLIPAIICFCILVLTFSMIYMDDTRFYEAEKMEVTLCGEDTENTSKLPIFSEFYGYELRLFAEAPYADRSFIINGFGEYTENEELFQSKLNGETTFFLLAENGPNVFILTCEDENGNVYLTEEQSRQRRKDITEFWMFLMAAATCIFTVGGLYDYYATRKKQRRTDRSPKKKDKK